jgi:hypothetical protein
MVAVLKVLLFLRPFLFLLKPVLWEGESHG